MIIDGEGNMANTIVFVTSQYSCDRLIAAGREIADQTNTNLIALSIMDDDYGLDAGAIDYLFTRSKEHEATMNLLFAENKIETMTQTIAMHDNQCIVTGMPNDKSSVLYSVWKAFPHKTFYTVDLQGEIEEVEKYAVENLSINQ